MTLFTVLTRDDEGTWHEIGKVEARSPKKAVSDLEDGVYVAVAPRSWKPLRVGVEHTKRVRVTAA